MVECVHVFLGGRERGKEGRREGRREGGRARLDGHKGRSTAGREMAAWAVCSEESGQEKRPWIGNW